MKKCESWFFENSASGMDSFPVEVEKDVIKLQKNRKLEDNLQR